MKLFTEMQSESHKLHHILPPIKVDNSVRAGKKYPLHKIKFERTKKSFVNWCLFTGLTYSKSHIFIFFECFKSFNVTFTVHINYVIVQS